MLHFAALPPQLSQMILRKEEVGKKGRAHRKRGPTESPGLTQLFPTTSFESRSRQRTRDPETTVTSNTAQRGRGGPEGWC